MKKILLSVSMIVVTLSMVACGSVGKSYVCKDCEVTTTKAYYDFGANKDSVMCETCARQYWMPLDYRTYRVK